MEETKTSDYAPSISVIAARATGLNNARSILTACRAEIEGDEALLGSDELDAITRNLYYSFKENAI